MSLQTWKQEFYPIPAKEASNLWVLGAVNNSPRKWKGLRHKNLKRHDCEVRFIGSLVKWVVVEKTQTDRGTNLVPIEMDPIEMGTDSLCRKYKGSEVCDGCPVAEARLGVPCTQLYGDEVVSPWIAFVCHKNPKPMIRVLKQARRYIEQKHNIRAYELSKERI